ncbi:diaminopimelate epimerase [Abyssogena phaseoliformis symbiont OG214]|uniref:diaminopimelate epimerase n=1 Tax=Abyssogena phaseoliformis symbiont TaxID=596095 RepID=UPI00191673B9|nr:diaminopimelate epimerase [Abyssogena phaseoliformis symbiont]MBW5289284.1 Diaminopimelate epimerase [Candidatus Ruthia sp. Apha_13_S6]BBB22691.1 diaminopimelate epimerase [Abyssogena phaseoliformis symbiont OG214]
MLINFIKMHGLGNDFMVVDNLAGDIIFNTEQIANLSNRHFGIGFDQLLVVETSSTKDVDFRYVIYNADGLEVEQCGNGARCFARFVSEKGLSNKNPIVVETRSGIISLHLNADNAARVDMGKPSLNPVDIPLLVPQQSVHYQIEGFDLGVVSIGNPHCVMLVEDVNTVDVSSIAPKVQQSKLLPNQANIGFMQILNTHEINLRVYERGSGETLACGSGACAAVVYGVEQGLLKENVVAHLNGGDALIEYTQGGHVFLSGPAQFVFEGQVEI